MEKEIEGYNGVYKINTKGEVFSRYKPKAGGKLHDKWIRLRAVLDKGVGYYLVTLVHPETKKRRNHFIHRLIATHFMPNPENKPQVNHKNGDKTDNRLENLEWVTGRENTIHAYKNGLVDVSKYSKPVHQYSLDGKYIRTFSSSREASRFTGIEDANINAVARGIRPFAGGFLWSREKHEKLEPYTAKKIPRCIRLYDKTNRVLRTLKPKYSEAEKITKIPARRIEETIRRKDVYENDRYIIYRCYWN